MRTFSINMILLLYAWIYPAVSEAGIFYEQECNILHILDYPEDEPATLRVLFEADQQNGWGKVQWAENSNTYIVDAGIWVGDADGYSSFLRIGAPQQQTTLIIRGSLWVRSAASGIKRSDGSDSIMNGLIIGDPSGTGVTATILFDCAVPGEHGLYAGFRAGPVIQKNCKLRMANASIGALHPNDPPRRWGNQNYLMPGKSGGTYTMGCHTMECRIEHCRFSDFIGPLFAGSATAVWDARRRMLIPEDKFTIKNCVFERGDAALLAQQFVVGCVFRGLNRPFRDTGTLGLMAFGCVFEENQQNWYLGGYGARDSWFVDCRFAPQKAPLMMSQNNKPNIAKGIAAYPRVYLAESVRVRVLDTVGNPVNGVAVEMTGDGPVLRGTSTTGRDGWTSADPSDDALVMSIRRYTATDNSAQPNIAEKFYYRITAASAGQTVEQQVSANDFERKFVLRLE